MADSLLGALEVVVRSDPGLVREHNEDSVFADTEHGLVILADGMGGYNAGEVASNMATTMLSAKLGAAFTATAAHQPDGATGQPFAYRCLLEQIAAVNLAIYRAAEGQSRFGGMGTTLVAAVFCDDQVIVAHVGDSRLYRLRDHEFVAMTHDHSVLQEKIDNGQISAEEARYSMHRNLVTRAVGVDCEVETEIHAYSVRSGDIYLLCSDGLYDMVDETDMRRALLKSSSNLELAVTQLVQMANENGGEDNISVVVVRVLHAFPGRKGRWSKLWSWLD